MVPSKVLISVPMADGVQSSSARSHRDCAPRSVGSGQPRVHRHEARSRFSARATYIASYAVTAVRSSQARSSRGGVANQPSRFQTSKARRALTEGIEPVRCERCPPRSCRQESSCRASSSAVHHETTAVTRAGSHADVGQSGDGVECGHGSSSDMGACCGPTLRAGLSRRGQIDPTVVDWHAGKQSGSPPHVCFGHSALPRMPLGDKFPGLDVVTALVRKARSLMME